MFEKGATGLERTVALIRDRAVRIGIWNEVQPLFGKLSASHATAWASQC